MNFKKIWTGIAIAAISFSGFVGVGTANAAPPEPTETNSINDYELKKFLNTQYFGNPADTNITAEQLETLTEIDMEGYESDFTEEEDQKYNNDGSEGYMDISGLRYAVNLKMLNLSGKRINPPYENRATSKAIYEELNYLTNLESLSLERTGLNSPTEYGFSDDFTLNLPNLTYLNLRNTYIDNGIYFISELNNLEELYLGKSYVIYGGEEIGQTLSQLDNVKRLDLSYNNIFVGDSLVNAVMDMDSLEWFNFEGNRSRDLRNWKPVADKVKQSSFANQQLDSSSRITLEADGTIDYDMDFYYGTYSFDRAYDVDGVEYILSEQGGLLYERSSEDLFNILRINIPAGEFTGDRTNSGIGKSYDIEELKNLNSDPRLYYGFGDSSTRGSFAFNHRHFGLFVEVGVMPNIQSVIEEVGTAIETQPLTVINSDATATYSTTDELPKGLTLDSETGVVSGIVEEPFDGMIEIIPTFSEDVSYNGQIMIDFIISEEATEPIIVADLPNGKVGEEYNGSIIVDSGEITTVDSLPNGLSYDYETGVVSGIPTEDGEFDVFIEVEKSGEYYDSIERLTILPADVVDPPVEEEPVVETPVNNSNLPDGKVGENYEGLIKVENGEITEVVGLPDGLTFNPDNGVVDGVPTKDGEFEISITAENEDIETVFTETIIIEAADVETPVDEDDTTSPDDSDDTVIDEEEEKEQIVPNDDDTNIDEVPDTDDVKPVNEVDKKVESGELSDNTSSPILYILSLIAGFGILSSVGLIRLKNKNN